MTRVPRLPLILAGLPLLLSCGRSSPVSVVSRYTEAMFVRALENNSTAPDYALITVVDGRDEERRLVCVEAPFIEGALQMEFGMPDGEAGERRAHKIALRQPGRVFRFSDTDALKNVRPRYTVAQLESVRAAFAGRSDEELLKGGFIDGLYRDDWSARDAVAHALLERGISCRRGCVFGNLSPYKR